MPNVSDESQAQVNQHLCVAGLVYFEAYLCSDTEHPPPGTEHFIPQIPLTIGGAFTSAVVAKALGSPVVLAYPSGKGVADAAAAEFCTRYGIEASCWSARSNPAISLVLTSKQERSFISSADFEALRACPELPEVEWVHVVGLQEAMLLDEQLAAAKQRGAQVSVAASWIPEGLSKLREKNGLCWDLLFLNRSEAEYAAGSVEAAFTSLQSAAREIVVTLDQGGAVAMIDGSLTQVPSEQTAVVDPTGAGDAFAAGYIAAALKGQQKKDCMRCGVMAASRIIRSKGTIDGSLSLVRELEQIQEWR